MLGTYEQHLTSGSKYGPPDAGAPPAGAHIAQSWQVASRSGWILPGSISSIHVE